MGLSPNSLATPLLFLFSPGLIMKEAGCFSCVANLLIAVHRHWLWTIAREIPLLGCWTSPMLSSPKRESGSLSTTASGSLLSLSLVTISLPHRLFFQHVLNQYLILTHHKAVHFPSAPFFFPTASFSHPLVYCFCLLSIHSNSSYSVYAFLLLLMSLLRSDFCRLLL